MISKISGRIDHVKDDLIVLELSGIFYEVMIPSGLADPLRAQAREGLSVSLYTFYYIESTASAGNMFPHLVGFTVPSDREFFKLFTTVSGIGIRKALRCLTVPVKDIARAIEERNTAVLKKLPGIGPRMAEKIVAELSGKAAAFALSRSDRPLSIPEKKKLDFEDEVYEVLSQLQYKPNEIDNLIRRALAENPGIKSTEEMIAAIFEMQGEAVAR